MSKNRQVVELVDAIGGTKRAAEAIDVKRRTIQFWKAGTIIPRAVQLAKLKKAARDAGWTPVTCDHCGSEIDHVTK